MYFVYVYVTHWTGTNCSGAKRSGSRDTVSWADALKGKIKRSSAGSDSSDGSDSGWQAWITSPYYKELEKLRATNATLAETTQRFTQELAEVKKALQAQRAMPTTGPV